MSEKEREKWDARYSDAAPPPSQPSADLVALGPFFPPSGRALDIAGGAGRHAVWLAERGFETTLVDISPVGLDLAAKRAHAHGVHIHTHRADLDTEPLPHGPWDLIVIFHFLLRPLFATFPQILAPNGILAVVHPTLQNLTRHPKPGADFVLREGELRTLVSDVHFDVLHSEEGWLAEGRHEARMVAKRKNSEPTI
ncbi:MAG: class I SAM-dependent methyltransferase [Polyangiaceae bacterium]|nr:class I SAM-dependent methyltransferase [Polyangiaceae bacterium]